MVEVFTQAPIQTRSDTLRVERLLSFLACEALNRIRDHKAGASSPRIDIWNTYGLKTESDYQQNHLPQESRSEFIDRQIQARYKFLFDNFGIDPANRISVRDDSEPYTQFVLSNLTRLIDSGVVIVSRQDFLSCQSCSYIFAPSESGLSHCPNCHQDHLATTTKNGMFLIVPPETKAKILANLSVHPEKEAGQELGRHLYTLPETIMISKQRQYGVPLQSFGVDSEFVLDPKISLSMMGPFVRQYFPSQKLGAVVQGIDSLGNLAPYASIIDPDWPQYLTHGLIPRQEPDGITKKNSDFYFPFLALLSFSCPRDLASTQLQAFSTEFHRTTSQARFNLSTNCDPKLAPLNLFTDLQTRRGYQAVRKAIYDGHNPPPEITKLLYGNIET